MLKHSDVVKREEVLRHLGHHMSICTTAVSSDKEHFGTASLVLSKEVALFGRLKIYWNYRERMFWDLKLCPL